MSSLAAGLWLLNLLLDTVGQLAFKMAARVEARREDTHPWRTMFSHKWVWLGILCYCIEFFSWLAFLSTMPLSAAVLLSTANIVTVALAGWVVFDERPTWPRSCGMALVAIGVCLVGAG